MMRTCARIVHRSFRRVESCAEWLTGAAGPVFVVLCTILVSIGGWTFFTTSFTKLAPLPEAIDELLGTANPVHFLLGLPAALAHQPLDTLRYVGVLASCAYIMLSIVVHYTLAIRESPGSVLTGLGPTRKERRTGPGSYMWWLERRRRAARASRGGGSGDDTRSVREMGLIDASDSVVDEACESEDLWAHVKMCHKCPKVPLVVALAALPPELRAVERQRRVQAQTSDGKGAKSAKRAMRATEAAEALPLAARGESEEDIRAWLGRDADKLVSPPKPERTHHCSVCKVCVLKFDHHCPWLNQCVGLGNERHFVLFMSWLAFGMFIVVASSWSIVQQSISFREHWQYTYTPRLFPLLTFTLCAIMGLALSVMAIWQLAIVAWGETSVENSDNSHYRELAKRKSHSFTNVYDVGRWRNIQLFFNIGPNSGHSVLTLLAPWRMQPYSDGWHWAKQRGLMGRHAGIEAEEELTDDEVERPDAHPMASVTH